MGLTFIEMSKIKKGTLTLISTLRVAKFLKEATLFEPNPPTNDFDLLTANIATHMKYY